MTVFDLGRMRHLDLLAMWLRLNPPLEAGADKSAYRLARCSKENLIAALLAGTTP